MASVIFVGGSDVLTAESEFVVVLADHGVELLVLTFGALCRELPLLLLQVSQLPLQALQVKRSSVPQQAARERVHVIEGDAGQPSTGPNKSSNNLKIFTNNGKSWVPNGRKRAEFGAVLCCVSFFLTSSLCEETRRLISPDWLQMSLVLIMD